MGKSSGAPDVDLNKVFPGLITPSFSLLPRSQSPGGALPTGFPGPAGGAGAPSGGITAAGGLPDDLFATLLNFTSGNAIRGPMIVDGRFTDIVPGTGLGAQELVAQMSPQQFAQFQGSFPRGRGDTGGGRGGGVFPGAGGGGGGGGDPFVLSRLGPDPALDEARIRGALDENTAGLRSLGVGLGRQERQLGRQFKRIDQGIRRSTQAQQRLGGLRRETRRVRGLAEAGLEDVEPGFGRLTQTQVAALRDREAQQQGNLRESLRNRRVLGSSFGIREQQRLERDFGQEEERVRAESFIAEMDTRRGIIDQIGSFLGIEVGIEGLSREFLALDQKSLDQRARAIALELGLNEQKADLLSQQFRNIQADAQLVQFRVTRELEELRIAGSLINQAGANATQLAAVQAQSDAASAAGFGEIIGAVAGIAGAIAICWVAREVYGQGNVKWLLFRQWLFTKAPGWLFKLYLKHGEKFARWLRGKPRLKAVIRKWMDARIATLELSHG